jgi:hypothetical protein
MPRSPWRPLEPSFKNVVRASPEVARRPAAEAANAVRPPLIIGCGALAPELVALTRRAGLPPMDLACLPASLHNRPEQITGAVVARIHRARRDGYDRIFVAYADCGTGGLLDRALEAEGVDRLAGAHCYEVFAGREAFAALAEAEPGTFYLTDFLARNFDRLVVRGLGLDRHPELLSDYFGNYRRLVYLAQTDAPALTSIARRGARRLGLTFERRFTGLGELAPALGTFALGAFARGARVVPNPAAAGPVSVSPLRRKQLFDGLEPETVRSLPPEEHVGTPQGQSVSLVRPMQSEELRLHGQQHQGSLLRRRQARRPRMGRPHGAASLGAA